MLEMLEMLEMQTVRRNVVAKVVVPTSIGTSTDSN